MTGFLKCDAEGCDHLETIEGLTEDLIGKPCPKCGADLLTREDYEEGMKIEVMMKMLKAMGLAVEVPASGDMDGLALLTVGTHNGETNIKIGKAK